MSSSHKVSLSLARQFPVMGDIITFTTELSPHFQEILQNRLPYGSSQALFYMSVYGPNNVDNYDEDIDNKNTGIIIM